MYNTLVLNFKTKHCALIFLDANPELSHTTNCPAFYDARLPHPAYTVIAIRVDAEIVDRPEVLPEADQSPPHHRCLSPDSAMDTRVKLCGSKDDGDTVQPHAEKASNIVMSHVADRTDIYLASCNVKGKSHHRYMAVCLDHVEQTSRKQRKVQNEAVLFYVIAGAEKNGGANILAMSINKLSLYSITALLNHMW